MTTTTPPTPSPQQPPPSNPRGIPSFPFLPHVTDYLKSPTDVEPTLTRFQEMISKYQFMSQNVERRAAVLREKLPEMRKSLDTVRFLRAQKGTGTGTEDETGSGLLETTYQLQDTLHAHATINTGDLEDVYLWLGANVMVAYPLGEAEGMLSEKLGKARESLRAAEEDLEFIRVQTTTLEVATARVHNWDVGEKRRLKELGQGKGDSKDGEGKEGGEGED